jgi:hypothetical protein
VKWQDFLEQVEILSEGSAEEVYEHRIESIFRRHGL